MQMLQKSEREIANTETESCRCLFKPKVACDTDTSLSSTYVELQVVDNFKLLTGMGHMLSKKLPECTDSIVMGMHIYVWIL